ncbi:hypothetical protein [Arthrobacter sp. H14-L1]|uniref:hypothetical protein n=1 Tax=Arthrobacter sp. H14-L1 TaxID=2996697 RepID=UPI002271D4DA|nr:hypothetical protein [Arthrobacter sp. H14-L1]MCY0904370.1 hypothetical protein [Arthrobacter sp. H14-L1]
MALLTTRQKQQLIGPVLLFLLIGGFIGGLWQGNPVAITILFVLMAGAALVIWLFVARKRKAKERVRAATVARREQDRSAAEEAIAKIKRLTPSKPERKTVSFQIPVTSDDTLETLTVRVMEHYAERGGSVPVAEAKAMAAKALGEQQE